MCNGGAEMREHEKRLKLYQQGLIDREIGEICGVTKEAVGLWRRKNSLKPNGTMESLCWECRNGYAKMCPWIGEGKQVWDKAKKEIRKNHAPRCRHKEYETFIVKKCKYFTLEEERKAI